MVYRHAQLLEYVATFGPAIYPLIAVAIFFEGEAVIYGVMFLVFQGVLSAYISIPVIIGSVVATDFISYQIGKHGHKFFPRLAKFYGGLTSPMDDRLHSLSLAVYMISKFTYGFHRAVLIRSGMIHIPFRKLLKINLITSAVWISVITLASYASWQSLQFVGKSLHYVELFLLGGIIVVLLLSHIVSHFTKMKLLGTPKGK